MGAEEDTLERGFQLAYFLVPNRTQAVQILAGALNKLSTQRRRERRRAYWRHKYMKRGITRITHQEADALQWLILFESDRLEREDEKCGTQTAGDMAVRYIKSLVRITTAMSSFHVNVGLHRLLHNYTTPEIQRIYETVTDRYLGTDEYRRAKRVIMTKLERRFGQLLRTFRSQYGELRFEAWEDQKPWRALTEKCLQLLTPWSTAKNCLVPANFGQENFRIPTKLAAASGAKISPDELEINRCHAFIDPACYSRLTHALAFDPPEQRLALPRFFMDRTQSKSKPDPPSPLTAEERKSLNQHVANESARRRDSLAQRVRVIVDGAEQAVLDTVGQKECNVEIDEGTELIEFLSEEGKDELLLATHRVKYREAQGIAASEEMAMLGRNRVLINIAPGELPVGEQAHRARLRVKCEPVETWRRDLRARPWWNFSKYAVAALALLTIGWVAGTRFSDYRRESRSIPATTNLASSSSPPSPTARPPAGNESAKLTAHYTAYTLVPDEEIERGAGGLESVSVVLPHEPALVRLDLPLPPGSSAKSVLLTLRLLQSRAVVLRQTIPWPGPGPGVPGSSSETGTVLSFWLPTAVLRDGQEYSIELSSGGKSRLEELSSYSFRTAAEARWGKEYRGKNQ